MARAISTNQLLSALKAAGEATRLRILALLLHAELNVSDLTHILDQSQPRISRHLRLLAEAGLIERFREGSFVYCRLAGQGLSGELVGRAISLLDPADPVIVRDQARANEIRQQRAQRSKIWFRANAAKWDEIRSLHVAESEVEAAMLEMLAGGPFEMLLDLGTGTGRVLELFAERTRQAIGVDSSHSMLDYARSRLVRKQMDHCQVRQGDLNDLAYEDGFADAVILHQVLHFMIEPQKVIREAARVLRPGGQLLLVDFAPHELEFLRDEFAHERLGFADEQIRNWLSRARLSGREHKQLRPSGKSDDHELTVSLWLAQKNEEAK